MQRHPSHPRPAHPRPARLGRSPRTCTGSVKTRHDAVVGFAGVYPGVEAKQAYEQVTMDAGAAAGYNPAGGGNQARDANAFNARSHQTTDNNTDLTAAASYTASDNYA
ncbi:MAG: hypothetical protein IPG23_17160, partial [Burkholderiales bacterium]|nr:hypothetical protein [Burkholderiales bacterium]